MTLVVWEPLFPSRDCLMTSGDAKLGQPGKTPWNSLVWDGAGVARSSRQCQSSARALISLWGGSCAWDVAGKGCRLGKADQGGTEVLVAALGMSQGLRWGG